LIQSFEQHQLTHFVDLRVGRGLQLGTTLGFHRGNLLTEKRVMAYTRSTGNADLGAPATHPQPQGIELLGQLRQARHP